MIITVTGGVSSGKSKIAEDIACFLGGMKIYIAAMESHGDEAIQRIEKHRKMREGKGFATVERSRDILGLQLEPCGTILFECVSTLLANEMFSGVAFDINKFFSGFEHLKHRADNIVIVTNDVSGVFTDAYSESVRCYIENMGRVNIWLANMSDVCIESVAGIPIFMKGGLDYEKSN